MDKILLIDDEPPIINAELRVLKKWMHKNSYEPITAFSGDEALEILAEEGDCIKIVVCDQRMPGIQGSELLSRLKVAYPDLVSIIMTGYADMASAIKAIDAGVFSYLIKPVDNEQLLNEVQKAAQVVTLKRENRQYLERIRQELQWASELQKELLKVGPLENEQVRFDSRYIPLKELGCGGDFYDIIHLPRNRYMLLIGDVAGHGIKAAFITTIIKQMLRNEYLANLSLMEASPAELLEWLNRRYHEEIADSLNILLTFSASLLDLEKMELTYSNGGHMPTLLKRGDEVRELQSAGQALGFTRTISFNEKICSLEPGDMLFLFTDGLVERKEGSIKDRIDLLKELLLKKETTDFALEDVISEIGGAEHKAFSDDVTAISVFI